MRGQALLHRAVAHPLAPPVIAALAYAALCWLVYATEPQNLCYDGEIQLLWVGAASLVAGLAVGAWRARRRGWPLTMTAIGTVLCGVVAAACMGFAWFATTFSLCFTF